MRFVDDDQPKRAEFFGATINALDSRDDDLRVGRSLAESGGIQPDRRVGRFGGDSVARLLQKLLDVRENQRASAPTRDVAAHRRQDRRFPGSGRQDDARRAAFVATQVIVNLGDRFLLIPTKLHYLTVAVQVSVTGFPAFGTIVTSIS